MLHRPGGSLSSSGQERDVVVAEGPVAAAADDADADRPTVYDHGYADQGPHALLGPARAEGLQARRVGQHGRGHRGGDRPGKALPDGNAQAGDLFGLHAVGREHPQLVVLEQQELRDIGAHHAAKAGKQLVQQPIRRQPGKPRVAQRRLAGRRVVGVSGHRGPDGTAHGL